MMKSIRLILILFIFFMIISSCATAPIREIQQPWTRTLGSLENLSTGKILNIEIERKTYPLLGNEQFTKDIIKDIISTYLTRRGYNISDTTPDYSIKIFYNTERSDKVKYSSYVSSRNLYSHGIGATSRTGASSGIGVAQAIGLLSNTSSIVSEQKGEQIISYTHTISLELYDNTDILLWKGEAAWDTEELDIIKTVFPAIKLLLRNYPIDSDKRPEVLRVKESYFLNYFNIKCDKYWFTCPALPYKIYFSDSSTDPVNRTSIPSGIKEPAVFEAYLDLIQTAEFVLPSGNENDWKMPLSKDLWKKVTIGGQYYIGVEKLEINILINLTGEVEGYVISECRTVSDEEYSQFLDKYSKWENSLMNYMDFYYSK